MKAWFEFPESSRYARRRNDILYTPIFFANEGVNATFRLDDEWQREFPLLQSLTAQITLTGRASLGFLSIGGRPASGFDHRYALPSVGFRPIYTLDLLELQQTLRLDDRYHDADDQTADNHLREANPAQDSATGNTERGGSVAHAGVAADTASSNSATNTTGTSTADGDPTEQEQREAADRSRPGHRHPFTFTLPTSTLNDIQQLASSLKVITADAKSTMSFLKDTSPALIVSVTYLLTGEVYHREIRKKADTNQEIRIFVGLTADQVPSVTEEVIARNPMAALTATSIIPIGVKKSSTGRRRSSISLLRRRSSTATTAADTSSSTSGQDDSFVIIEAHVSKPFTFRRQDDAAATKALLTLTYHGGAGDNPPPTMTGNATWMLKTLTSLTLEPVQSLPNAIETEDDYFHLRAKVLPTRKHKLKWDKWTKVVPSSQNGQSDRPDTQPARYTATTELWLTQPTTATLSPSFTTPYLSHLYVLNIVLSLSTSESSIKSPFGTKQNVELNVPVQVRYDLGLAPSYEVDDTLPEYDYTLPRYSDDLGQRAADGGGEGGRAEGVPIAEDADDEVMAALMRRAARLDEGGGRLTRTYTS